MYGDACALEGFLVLPRALYHSQGLEVIVNNISN